MGSVHLVDLCKFLTLVGSVHFVDKNLDPSWGPPSLWTYVEVLPVQGLSTSSSLQTRLVVNPRRVRPFIVVIKHSIV